MTPIRYRDSGARDFAPKAPTPMQNPSYGPDMSKV